jgi:hypothetical protein
MTPNLLSNMNLTPSGPAALTSVSAKKSVQRKAGSPSTTKTATAVSKSTVEKNMEAQPSNEQIALRAYFIGERRRKLGFPGDEISDWVLAEREISEE